MVWKLIVCTALTEKLSSAPSSQLPIFPTRGWGGGGEGYPPPICMLILTKCCRMFGSNNDVEGF